MMDLYALLCILSLLSHPTEAILTPIKYHCPNTTAFTPNSTYQANLHLVLSSLRSNATSKDGFYYSYAGWSPPEQVFGSFLCKGDLNIKDCQECVVNATEWITQLCPTSKESIIWYDQCMLRYSNSSFLHIMETEPPVVLDNNENIVSDPDHFMPKLISTMNHLVSRLLKHYSTSPSTRKFDAEEAKFTKIDPIYSFAQCTPDISATDCQKCLQKAISHLPGCCKGKIGGRVLLPSCFIRYEKYPFYYNSSKGSLRIIIAITASAVAVVVLLTGYWLLRKKILEKHCDIEENFVGTEISAAESLQFSLDIIKAATSNFSNDNKLGEGGFGAVYKGKLPSGQEIAAKRLSKSSHQGAEEFKNEVMLIAKLQHRNLVRLLGFCLGEEKILVYEFVPNKSLDHFLFDPKKQGQLDWSRRYKIIIGIARGIVYLHEDSRLRIIHRDLKASNILLDGDMNPRISDFGVARIFGVDQTQGSTNRIVGTVGYMSPEYAMHGEFSVKSDVYSFGVLILEIISGKKRSFYRTDCDEDLVSHVWKHWRDGAPLEVLDQTLTDTYSGSEVVRCIHIGLLCVQEDPVDRPTMATVVSMLGSLSVSLPLPRQGTFFQNGRIAHSMSMEGLESYQSTSELGPQSVGEASITESTSPTVGANEFSAK